MSQVVPVPALVTRAMRVSMEELEGNDPGAESSGYEEGQSECARREELKTVESRALLLKLPGKREVGPPPSIETEGGVYYVGCPNVGQICPPLYGR